MTRYFLPTNEGLSRRFPNKLKLRDMDTDALVAVFKKKLLEFQGIEYPKGRRVDLESDSYFTDEAWDYLRHVIDFARRGSTVVYDEDDPATKKRYAGVRRFEPDHPYLHRLFDFQAGSMANLADEAILVLFASVSFKTVSDLKKKAGGVDARPVFRDLGVDVMRDILDQRILTTSVSNYDEAIQELSACDEEWYSGQ